MIDSVEHLNHMAALARNPNFDWSRRRAWLSAFAAIVVGLFSILFIVVPPLRWDLAYAPWVDTTWVYGPMFCEASKQWMTGHIPTFSWLSYETFQYDAHFSPFYPFYLFGVWNFCSPEDAIEGLDIISSLHLVFLYLNMLVLGRAMRLNAIPAVFAATSVTTALNFHRLAAWPPIIASAGWLPLAIAGIIYIVARERYVGGFIFLVLGTTLLLYAGPGSNMIFCLVYMGLILSGCGFAFNIWHERRRATVLSAITLGAAAVAILLLNLSSTINLLQHLPELIRWTRTGPVIGSATPGDALEILSEQQDPSSVTNLVLPFRERLVGSFYVGPLLAALAFGGFRFIRRDSAKQAFTIMVVMAIALMYFDPVKAALLLTHIPGMSHVRHLSLLATPMVIGMSLLAALTLDRLTESSWNTSRVKLACIILGSAFVLPAATAYRDGSASVALSGGLACLGALVMVLVFAVVLSHRWASLACLSLVPFQVAVSLMNPWYAFAPATDTFVRSKTWHDVEAAVHWITASDPQPGRLVFDGHFNGDELSYTSAGSIALYAGLSSFQFAYSPRVYWRFVQENYKFPDYTYYGLRGGKYVVATNVIDDSSLEPYFQRGSVWVYQIRDSRPVVAPLCGTDLPTSRIAPAVAKPGRLPDLTPEVAQTISAAWAKPGTSCDPLIGLAVDKKRSVVTWNVASDHGVAEVINLPPYKDWSLKVGEKQIALFDLADSQILALLPADAVGKAVLTYRPTQFYGLALCDGFALCILTLILLAWRRRSYGSRVYAWISQSSLGAT